jgi:hypothetical protein
LPDACEDTIWATNRSKSRLIIHFLTKGQLIFFRRR